MTKDIEDDLRKAIFNSGLGDSDEERDGIAENLIADLKEVEMIPLYPPVSCFIGLANLNNRSDIEIILRLVAEYKAIIRKLMFPDTSYPSGLIGSEKETDAYKRQIEPQIGIPDKSVGKIIYPLKAGHTDLPGKNG